MNGFLDRPTQDLLDLFAAGKNTPGAGSAAALAGALAGSLIQSVALYTLRAAEKKGDQEPLRERAEAILDEARRLSERLRAAVDADAAAFDEFWKMRANRDMEKEKALRRAIDIPTSIADDCLALAGLALELHEKGFKNAQGEAAAAALSALANGEAALYAARVNLKFITAGRWADAKLAEAGALRRRLREVRGWMEERL
ncbi:MAG: cyclodeaminase/cyclohydrolase family protein [Acidobacteriota bacterium]